MKKSNTTPPLQKQTDEKYKKQTKLKQPKQNDKQTKSKTFQNLSLHWL